jgi:hypothetical protein
MENVLHRYLMVQLHKLSLGAPFSICIKEGEISLCRYCEESLGIRFDLIFNSVMDKYISVWSKNTAKMQSILHTP